ncbi:MAG: GIY-YIG nuclease family protein [Candidatus Brennerbacteria bacterium]|nr:GIY-YIG nuclease family protein [Candidatus Brennerbacteria bacterium]
MFLFSIIKKIKTAPKTPGVYIFYKGAKPLYIGKAVNLRNRLAFYLKEGADSKIDFLQTESDRLVLRRLSSGIKALIVESQLIKKLRPLYNVLMKDDKSYFYVAFTHSTGSGQAHSTGSGQAHSTGSGQAHSTGSGQAVLMKDDKSYFYVAFTHSTGSRQAHSTGSGQAHSTGSGQAQEKFPRVFITHKFINSKSRILNSEFIGPFTDGQSLKIVLRVLRRILPYCSCRSSHRRFCLNSQIGNCPGFCCQIGAEPDKKQINQYRRNINLIKNFLLGKKIPGKFQREMERLTGDKLAAFENISGHREFLESFIDGSDSRFSFERFERAEAYDISHLSGKEAVGAMTAWVKKDGVWEAEKSLWRKFKIKTAPKSDDPRAIAEVISRRFNYPEWPFPDLVIIDGGLNQLSAAVNAINFLKVKNKKNIKIISFAKPHKLIYGLSSEPLSLEKVLRRGSGQASLDLFKFIQKAIYYTHNFAVRYHRSLRENYADFLRKY